MSLLDVVDDLPAEFLRPEEAEEAVLIETAIDLQGVDETEVVYVDDVNEILIPEEAYQAWPDGNVIDEEAVDSGEVVTAIELQQYVDEDGTVYNSEQYDYEQDVDVDVEGGPFLDTNMSVDSTVGTHYIDCDGVEYIEASLLPLDSEGLIEQEMLALNESNVNIDGGEVMTEFGEVETEQMSTGHRKPATIVQCEICGAVLKHPSKIEAHMRTHTGEKPFECNICGTKFTQRTPMINHIRRHLGQMPYSCSYGCGKKFVNNAQKNAHELRHLGTKRAGPPRPHLKPPKRTICHRVPSKPDPRTRQSEEERSTMVDFAPPVGQIEPPISAAASKRLDEIIESVVSGVPVKKRKTRPTRAPMLVQCQICGLMLKHASKIRAHIRTHTGDKPYICVYCDEQFGTSGTLSMHIKRKHTLGERPYACTWDCGKRFVSLSTRNEHERVVHAGAKRYECTVAGCFRMFSRRQYLMLHRQREHGLLYKPIFDPEEIANAEKEADEELRLEQQGNMSNQYGRSDQVLVDPSTNILVHVSADGLALEPEIEQHTYLQGEFVEENEETTVNELVTDGLAEMNPTGLYVDSDSKLIQYMPSNMGLDSEPSGAVSVPMLEEEVVEEHVERTPHPTSEQSLEIRKNEVSNNDECRKLFKGRTVNILKKRLPQRSPVIRRT